MDLDTDTLGVLQRVATHVVARARVAETGRFSLRVLAGGFGTPEMGSLLRRVRVSGTVLVVESDTPDAPSASAMEIAGASLRTLATFAGVDLGDALDVGHDTPEQGDPDEALALDAGAADHYHRWWALASTALDRVAAGLDPGSAPTMARLWPEHFDVALSVAAGPDARVNLGGSPGDGFSAEPYLYVGPWTDARPGDASFWNAPFGAVMRRSELGADDVAEAAAFFRYGLRQMHTDRRAGA